MNCQGMMFFTIDQLDDLDESNKSKFQWLVIIQITECDLPAAYVANQQHIYITYPYCPCMV